MGRKGGANPGQRMLEVTIGRHMEALKHHNAESMKQLIVQYHQMFISPIEFRIRHLEKPFYRRWPIDVGRMIQSAWVKLFILLSWRITDDMIQKEGWREKRYQGLASRTPENDGFVYMLKPFHFAVRFHDAFRQRRQERRDKRAAAEADRVAQAAIEAAAEEPTEEPVADDG